MNILRKIRVSWLLAKLVWYSAKAAYYRERATRDLTTRQRDYFAKPLTDDEVIWLSGQDKDWKDVN